MANVTAVPGAGGWGAARIGRSPAPALFERPIQAARSATVLNPERTALVLGSAQKVRDGVEAAAADAGVDLVRRHSGGGAVWLDPTAVVWIDVVVPAGDPLWEGDVAKAFWWLGVVWADALHALGAGRAAVHRGPLKRTVWSNDVCFAGLGAGEVSLDGRKVVGISQRRTRDWCLFQAACLLRWDPMPLAETLRLPHSATFELASVAAGLGPGVEPIDVETAFLETLHALHP